MNRIAISVLLAVLAGCATDSAFVDGKRLIELGRAEEGLPLLHSAATRNPNNYDYQSYYIRARDLYVSQLAYEAEKARLLGRLDESQAQFERALAHAPASRRAQSGLDAVRAERRQRAAVTEAQALFDDGKSEQALTKIKTVLAENPSQRDAQSLQRRIEETQVKSLATAPTLKDTYKKPVTLEFRDAPLKSVFEVLSRASGINFVFDRDVRPDLKATIFLRETSIEDAVNFLLVTNQLEKKILNENTILVFPNLPNKNRDYQELTVKSFYLANADVKQTLNLIKTVVKTRDVFIDERLNLLVMRDTPQAIRLAEKLIAAQDLAEPEVILEVEVLEVQRSKLQELGLRYPTQVSAGIEGASEGPGRITLDEWLTDRSQFVRFNITDPAFVINLKRQDGNTNILANPRIRVRNREKAKIHIGDRLPVITTTSTANVGVSESVQYLDVGLKLDVESNVYLENEVAMKVALEVSNIVQEIRSQRSDTLTYRIGTRNTATVLRVANGETQVLAGLIQDEDRKTMDKLPGLGDLPVLGRLFSNRNESRLKTEIVLLITPYIVRNVDRPGPGALEFASGTEGSLGASPLRLPSTAAVRSAIDAPQIPGATVAPLTVETQPTGEPIAARPLLSSLLLSAPLQVQSGREFAVAVSVPPGLASRVQLDLNYDAAKLQAVGQQNGGHIALTVTGTAAVRFRAIEGQSGAAQISIANVAGVDSAGATVAITAPAPVEITIVP